MLGMGKKEVKIDKKLVKKLEERAKEKGFKSVDKYIEEILKKALQSFEKKGQGDEEKVKERLRALGYLE